MDDAFWDIRAAMFINKMAIIYLKYCLSDGRIKFWLLVHKLWNQIENFFLFSILFTRDYMLLAFSNYKKVFKGFFLILKIQP